MSERKAVIKNADMSEDMQQDAIDCATQVTPLPLFTRSSCGVTTLLSVGISYLSVVSKNVVDSLQLVSSSLSVGDGF